MDLPSGLVTFLFTDIEGSTRRWETDPAGMRAALAEHDSTLRAAVAAHRGAVFKHTGDGMCAVFAAATDAVAAAVRAQGELRLPVRMGIAAGWAEVEDGDYFGPTLNRTARVMGAGHGGQILVAASAAELLEPDVLVDLGEHRLRDLSDATRLFQVRGDGLRSDFPPLKTVDDQPGNLPVQLTTFVGRDLELKEVTELVRTHRHVTLSGVGGVGKTRLALEVGANVVGEFLDGVWLVELAHLSDPADVCEATAAVLSVVPQAVQPLQASLVDALRERRALLIFDNCEHVLDGCVPLVQAVLTGCRNVRVLTTSRELLGLPAEHVWPVPPLDVVDGEESGAVALFVDRARAVNPAFRFEDDPDGVVDICRRLDGLALAIELAAARMVSMTVADLRERLQDRFRLLSAGPRGVPHHQTLRHAISWSYDLLTEDEQTVLCCCARFFNGFDLEAAVQVCGPTWDEFAVLDLLDSLVRKSLVNAERAGGHVRYGMLETIRQFADAQPLAVGLAEQVRARHAAYYAAAAIDRWEAMWNRDRFREAIDWVDRESANLRAAFRWAADHDELETATAIAAHATLLGFALQWTEPVGWAHEILDAATAAAVSMLPRLYSAASLCTYTGRPDLAIELARTGLRLELDERFNPFERGWTSFYEAIAHRFAGNPAAYVQICGSLIGEPGLAGIVGLVGTTFVLPLIGRSHDVPVLAPQALEAARSRGNPFLIAWALNAYGRAFIEIDPLEALRALREGLAYAQEHRVPFWVANIARDAAALEAAHGELEDALQMFEETIDTFYRSGNVGHAAATIASLASLFSRLGDHATAATIYGASSRHASINMVINLPEVVERLRAELGPARFEEAVARGAAMDVAEAVRFSRACIHDARRRAIGGDR